MIQRIQTIYLFLSSVVLTVFSFFTDFNLLNINTTQIIDFVPTFMALLSAVVAFATIFMYKNRNSQARVALLASLLPFLAIPIFIYVFTVQNFYTEWSFYLLIVAFLSSLLARHNIIKDEKLVKSADRLR